MNSTYVEFVFRKSLSIFEARELDIAARRDTATIANVGRAPRLADPMPTPVGEQAGDTPNQIQRRMEQRCVRQPEDSQETRHSDSTHCKAQSHAVRTDHRSEKRLTIDASDKTSAYDRKEEEGRWEIARASDGCHTGVIRPQAGRRTGRNARAGIRLFGARTAHIDDRPVDYRSTEHQHHAARQATMLNGAVAPMTRLRAGRWQAGVNSRIMKSRCAESQLDR